MGERVEPEVAHRVLAPDHAHLVVGHAVELLGERLGGVRPRRVGVRVVDLPRDRVDADLVAQLDADAVLHEARDDVLAEHVARELPAEVLSGPTVLLLVGAVDALEEIRHPPDAALGEADLQAGVAAQEVRPDDVGGDLHDVHGHEGQRDVDRRLDRRDRDLRRRADVEADHRALVRARGPERVPPLVVQAREARLLRVFRERERVAALRRHAPDLGDHRVLVPDRRDRERDEPTRVRAAPLVDVPVVVRLEHGQRAVVAGGAAGVEHATAEARERREAHRTEHAVHVHVTHAGVDLVAAVAHLPERHGVHAVLLRRTPGHRVQAEVGAPLLAPHPHVGAVRGPDDAGRAVAPALGEVTVEHPGGLDDVVVDADQD